MPEFISVRPNRLLVLACYVFCVYLNMLRNFVLLRRPKRQTLIVIRTIANESPILYPLRVHENNSYVYNI